MIVMQAQSQTLGRVLREPYKGQTVSASVLRVQGLAGLKANRLLKENTGIGAKQREINLKKILVEYCWDVCN